MTFNTKIFELKALRKTINELEKLLVHSKAVLLSAGASRCVNLPFTNELIAAALYNNKLDTICVTRYKDDDKCLKPS
jgi:hypothetical protein